MIEQAGIVVFGLVAAWLSQDARPRWSRWACIAGLCGQPFWLVASIEAEQWGVLALSFFYLAAWCRGLLAHWVRPWRARRQTARAWRPRPPFRAHR